MAPPSGRSLWWRSAVAASAMLLLLVGAATLLNDAAAPAPGSSIRRRLQAKSIDDWRQSGNRQSGNPNDVSDIIPDKDDKNDNKPPTPSPSRRYTEYVGDIDTLKPTFKSHITLVGEVETLAPTRHAVVQEQRPGVVPDFVVNQNRTQPTNLSAIPNFGFYNDARPSPAPKDEYSDTTVPTIVEYWDNHGNGGVDDEENASPPGSSVDLGQGSLVDLGEHDVGTSDNDTPEDPSPAQPEDTKEEDGDSNVVAATVSILVISAVLGIGGAVWCRARRHKATGGTSDLSTFFGLPESKSSSPAPSTSSDEDDEEVATSVLARKKKQHQQQQQHDATEATTDDTTSGHDDLRVSETPALQLNLDGSTSTMSKRLGRLTRVGSGLRRRSRSRDSSGSSSDDDDEEVPSRRGGRRMTQGTGEETGESESVHSNGAGSTGTSSLGAYIRTLSQRLVVAQTGGVEDENDEERMKVTPASDIQRTVTMNLDQWRNSSSRRILASARMAGGSVTSAGATVATNTSTRTAFPPPPLARDQSERSMATISDLDDYSTVQPSDYWLDDETIHLHASGQTQLRGNSTRNLVAVPEMQDSTDADETEDDYIVDDDTVSSPIPMVARYA
jgi:hypothetical protein